MLLKKIFIKKIEDKKKLFFLYLFNLIALFPLIVFYHPHYSVDTYGIQYYGEEIHLDAFIGSFRYFGALLYKIFSLFGHNPIINPLPDIIFYIFTASIIVTALTITLYKHLELNSNIKYLIINFCVLITVVNVWFCNILTFPECIALTSFGLAFCFIAIILFIKHTSSNNLLHIILSSICLILSMAVYQQYVTVFAIYIIAYCCKDVIMVDKIKQIVIKYLKPIAMIFISCVIYFVVGIFIQNVLSVKANERVDLSLSTIFENLIYFVTKQRSFLKGRGYFETDILTICYLAVFIIWLISLIFYWKKNRKTLKCVIIGLSFIAGYSCSYLLGLISTSHGIRTMFGLFSVFALFAIGAIILSQNKYIPRILLIILFSVYSMNIVKDVTMSINQVKTNVYDSVYADSITNYINDYEKKEKIQIKNISYSFDSVNSRTNFSSDVYTSYAFEAMLLLKSDTPYTFIKMPDEIYNENFASKDWEYFNPEEQMIFDNDILYLCIY